MKTKTPRAAKAEKAVKAPREPKITVTDANIKKAALRLLSQSLVSTEVSYVQRTLGARATQQDLDTQIIAVRKLPWGSITIPD
jgi:hypothetical protein